MSTALHPRDGEIVEYVVGTMPGVERDAFARDVERDAGLAAAVRAWEVRLAPIAEAAVAPVPPSGTLWTTLAGALSPAEAPAPSQDGSGPGSGAVIAWPVSPELVRLRRSRALWRTAAVAAGSLAAALALLVMSDRTGPVRPQARLVAVVNRSGELPALLVRVDPRAGTVQVRAVAAETPPGRSLELWSIVAGGAPRSLGVIGAPGGPGGVVPAADRATLDGATLAVSVEPPGGSTTGGPTGPVVYSGKLVTEPE